MKLYRWLLLPLLFVLAVSAHAERVIEIDLTLDPTLAHYADQSWIVYVFAKPEGKRVPVASKKLKLNQVPMKVVLTESNYLLENLTLASAERVVVAAKVTRHGSPHKTVVGDLLGQTEAVDFGGGDYQQVRLNIDREVQ